MLCVVLDCWYSLWVIFIDTSLNLLKKKKVLAFLLLNINIIELKQNGENVPIHAEGCISSGDGNQSKVVINTCLV